MSPHSPVIEREDVPRGGELAVTRSAIKLTRILDEECSDFFDLCHACIAAGHSKDGVRTNGWERLTTVIDVIDYLVAEQIGVIEKIGSLGRYQKSVEATIKQLNDELISHGLKRCPDCNHPDERGEGLFSTKGALSKRDNPAGGTPMHEWTDCYACCGRGLVKRCCHEQGD